MIILHTQDYVMNFGNPRSYTLKIDIHQHLKEVSLIWKEMTSKIK